MKLVAAHALATAAFVLIAASSAAGAARPMLNHPLGVVPHHWSTHRVAAPRKTAGFNCGSSCLSYQTAINKFFTDVAAASGTSTNVYGVATQYCQGVLFNAASCDASGTPIAYTSTFGGSYVDSRPFPASVCNDGVTIKKFHKKFHYADKYCLTDAQIQTEIENVIAANSWPTDSTRLFFVFTPANVGVCQFAGTASLGSPCTTNVFCAYHSYTQSNILYAVEPDDAQIPDGGCDTGQTPVGFGADATISTISHEQNETITDPFLDGWWTADKHENGDLCAYNFGAPLGGLSGFEYNQVINGTDYFLQQEYSNADGGCLQQPGGTVSPVDPRVGTGPLLFHGGSVMLTNTTYAIYWVPAAPVGDTHLPPRINGATQVGKKLKAFHGNWTYGLTYAYRWLRCSAAGTACKPIKKATDSHYVLTPADAGHRIEVHVTAANQAGRASATSVPTAKVRS